MEYDFEMDYEELPSKRSRNESRNEALIGGSSFETDIPLHGLLKAISENKKSLLVSLVLNFEVSDEIIQTIAKLKGLRSLECGLCDEKSISHLKASPNLARLVLFNKGHLISDNFVHLLKKHMPISSLDTKMNLTKSGHLGIETSNAAIYKNINVEPFFKIENLKKICLFIEGDISMGSGLERLLEHDIGYCII